MTETATDLPPLDGIRVVDLSRVLAGPYCTVLLADAGADVIKVEPPTGDDARHLGPFRNEESIYFDILNRGKRSMVLDLKNPDDHTTLIALIRSADVVVENFRPGVTERLRIGYEDLRTVNPRLIYVSISGFGQRSPMGDSAAYDLVVQALSGLMSTTGQPNSMPTRVGESIGDLAAGLFAAWAVSTALVERQRSGIGQHLDVAMFDSLLALEVTGLSQLQANGRPPTRVGNRHPVSTPFDTFRAADGLVVIAVANQAGFVRLMTTLGEEQSIHDSRFADDRSRTLNEQDLKEIIERWTIRRTVAEVVDQLGAVGLACAPIWDLAQATESAQTVERGLLGRFQHPVSGNVQYVRQPVLFSRSEAAQVRRSPLLDEHGAQLRAQLDPTDSRPS